MFRFTLLFKKTVLLALVSTLALTALPLSSVSASGLYIPNEPPTGESEQSNDRIEQIWVRLLKAYERQGQMLDRAGELIGRIQNTINRMEENGKDVVALRVALDAFDAAYKEVHPIHESAKGIINSHKGFDAEGKVIDRDQAIETVKELGAKMKEIREIAREPGKALREAIKAFREAYRPAETSDS